MILGSEVFIITNQGFRTVSQLVTSYTVGKPFPQVLTYNWESSDPTLSFDDISMVEAVEEPVELFEVNFIENSTSRVITTTCSLDTKFLKYNIVNTSIEPIINRTHNVYAFIANNNKPELVKHTELIWTELREMTNFGVASPFLTFSDQVVQFLDKKAKLPDIGYRVVGSSGDPIPIFTSKVISHSNFMLTL